MLKKLVIEIDKKIISIYYEDKYNDYEVPVVIINSFEEDGEKIYNQVKSKTNNEFIIVSISNIDWNSDLSPWKAKAVFKGEEDFKGMADEYIKTITFKIIPELTNIIILNLDTHPKCFILGGYSLAGLFAIYALYKSSFITKAFSASGSMWYPGFVEFVEKNELKRLPDKVYFSLGNKEAKTKNEIMSKVEENTRKMVKLYKDKEIDVVYEENEGNHFQDVEERIAKAIAWMIK